MLAKTGISFFILAMVLFTLMPLMETYQLKPEGVVAKSEFHTREMLRQAEASGMLGKTYRFSFQFIAAYEQVLSAAQVSLDQQPVPEGVAEWDFRIGNWDRKEYVFQAVRQSGTGWVTRQPLFFLGMTVLLGLFGGLLYTLPKFKGVGGIRNNHVYHRSLTRGLKSGLRKTILGVTITGVLVYGYFYTYGDLLWPVVSAVLAGVIIGLVYFRDPHRRLSGDRSSSPSQTGMLGLLTGLYLIGFYILLYWSPQFMVPWIVMVDPVSRWLSGQPASQWFLYGFLYTIVILVMGVRMLARYRHNRYQVFRTISVMFFQTAFAFLIPEILARLNQPYYDFKNIWPLNYTFFFDWNLKNLMENGHLGLFMLVWGIVLIVIAVPVFTYFFGKRWYCSWVCGCGGLAETMGDPFRQLSDKSLKAWIFERWIIHGVLVFAVVMTGMVLYTYFTGSHQVVFISSDSVRGWYGFLIGSSFAGIVGTGFYPFMGNRVWCRFGCPLAAYLGLIQKFRSRFRITVNGGQCISCGNCSTYCEMGIDVRHYAQRGQDVVRASCVGCGICAAVCPRGIAVGECVGRCQRTGLRPPGFTGKGWRAGHKRLKGGRPVFNLSPPGYRLSGLYLEPSIRAWASLRLISSSNVVCGFFFMYAITICHPSQLAVRPGA